MNLLLFSKTIGHEDITTKVLKGFHFDLYKFIIDVVNARDNLISYEEIHEKLVNLEMTVKNWLSPFLSFSHVTKTQPSYPRTQTRTLTDKILPTRNTTTFTRTSRLFSVKVSLPGTLYVSMPSFQAALPKHNFFFASTCWPTAQYCVQRSKDTSCPCFYNRFTFESSWLLDNGKSRHIVNDLNNLSLHAPFDGTEDLTIGDGSIPISRTSFFTLSTSHKSSTFSTVFRVVIEPIHSPTAQRSI